MKRYFSSIKQYSWILLACLLLALMAGFFVAKSQPTVYQASTVVIVQEGAPGTTYPGGPSGGTSADSLAQALNYAAEIPTFSVMNYIIKFDPQLSSHGYTAADLILDVTPSTATTAATITLLATATHPVDAVLIANDVANGFASYIQTQAQQQLSTQRANLQTQITAAQADKAAWEGKLEQQPNNTTPQWTVDQNNIQADSQRLSTLQQQLQSLPPTVNGDVSVIQPATSKSVTTTPKGLIIMGVIGLVGLLIGILVMLLVIFLDKRLRSDEQVKEKLGMAYLGGLSNNNQFREAPTRVQGDVLHEISDIGMNLRLTGVLPGAWQAPQGAVLLVTSPQAAEGKTTLAAALAATLARGGNSVLVMDGNLRQPATHLAFGMNGAGLGLSGLLRATGRESTYDAVVRTNVPGVWMVPAGPAMADATLLLEQKLPVILAQLRKEADVIIIDGPALLSGADASLLATLSDGIALVIDTRHEKLPLLLRAKELLNSLTHTPAGIVMNRLAQRERNNYYASAYLGNAAAEKWIPVQAHVSNGHGNEVGSRNNSSVLNISPASSPNMSRLPTQLNMPSLPSPSGAPIYPGPSGMPSPNRPAPSPSPRVQPNPSNDIMKAPQNGQNGVGPSPRPAPRPGIMIPPQSPRPGKGE